MKNTKEKKDRPFFSVVIPTRNRPEYLYECIYSVLHQSFKEIECILSDNFNDERTYEAIQPFLDDPRFKYIRTTAELNMMEHWEWASRQASGKYVLILADRKVLYPNGLKKARHTLLRYPDITTCSMGVKLYEDTKKTLGWSVKTGKTRLFRTEELISNFLQEDIYGTSTLDVYFPKTLNSFYLNSYVAMVREQYGSYFNLPGVTTPDYSSFMINCALNESTLYIGENVILKQGESVSNGRIFVIGDYTGHLSSLRNPDPYNNMPLHAPFTANLLFSDFLQIKKIIGGHLSTKEIDWENYLYICLREYYLFKKDSPLIDTTAKLLFIQEWEKAAAALLSAGKITQPALDGMTQRVLVSLAKQPHKRVLSTLHLQIRDYMIHHYGHLEIVNKIFPHRFDNALQAAGF